MVKLPGRLDDDGTWDGNWRQFQSDMQAHADAGQATVAPQGPTPGFVQQVQTAITPVADTAPDPALAELEGILSQQRESDPGLAGWQELRRRRRGRDEPQPDPGVGTSPLAQQLESEGFFARQEAEHTARRERERQEAIRQSTGDLSSGAAVIDPTKKARLPWLSGGGGQLFADLTWTNRPDMTGSEAPECLQDAWVATMLAIRALVGRVPEGSCFLVNLAACPLVQRALGEPVTPCAGYTLFVGNLRRAQIGHRWRPEKWAEWIDASASAHLRPLQDVHTWLETKTHLIDFSAGDTMGDLDGDWPPLVYWPKWRLPKHPREARGPCTMLLWRSPKAIETVIQQVAPTVAPITARAMEILEARGNTDTLTEELTDGTRP